jgi:hypothetical protein
MSVDNAWRRYGGAAQNSAVRWIAWPAASLVAVARWNAAWLGLQALLFAATFVLGAIALVRLVDLVLDCLHNKL